MLCDLSGNPYPPGEGWKMSVPTNVDSIGSSSRV